MEISFYREDHVFRFVSFIIIWFDIFNGTFQDFICFYSEPSLSDTSTKKTLINVNISNKTKPPHQ